MVLVGEVLSEISRVTWHDVFVIVLVGHHAFHALDQRVAHRFGLNI